MKETSAPKRPLVAELGRRSTLSKNPWKGLLTSDLHCKTTVSSEQRPRYHLAPTRGTRPRGGDSGIRALARASSRTTLRFGGDPVDATFVCASTHLTALSSAQSATTPSRIRLAKPPPWTHTHDTAGWLPCASAALLVAWQLTRFLLFCAVLQFGFEQQPHLLYFPKDEEEK